MPAPLDLHTHFFGPDFYRTLAAAAHPAGDPEPGFARLMAAGIDVVRNDPEAHAARWLAEMDGHGLRRMVTFASIPEEAASVGRAAATTGGRLVPFALVDPLAPGVADRVGALAGGHGMRGLLLFPAMHKFLPSDRALDPFYEAASHLGLPVIVHMGTLRIRVRDLLGLPTDFDISCANPVHLAPAAQRFGRIRFIIPHFGGGYFRETLMVGSQCANVAVDTSSSNSWIRMQPGRLTLREVFEQALDIFGSERIHFGTDSSTFPRGWRDDIARDQRAVLRELGVGEAVETRILSGNTAALLGD